MVYATSTGRRIPDRTAIDLSNLLHTSCGENLAGQLWRDVFTEQEREILGGDFKAAYRAEEYGGIGMFHRVHREMSFERALLEATREAGWILQPRYERLVKDIGESLIAPPNSGELPRWSATQGDLFWHDRVVRHIRQPGRARNIVSVLNAFERHGWPIHLPLEAIHNVDALQIRQTLYDLNRGLGALRFRMDGQAKGIVWEVMITALQKQDRFRRPADSARHQTAPKANRQMVDLKTRSCATPAPRR